jgi:hypothetical protein
MDFWIISTHRFKQHKSFEVAEQELYRLHTARPDENFRIYRCKTSLNSSGHVEQLLSAVAKLLAANPVKRSKTADGGRRGAKGGTAKGEGAAARRNALIDDGVATRLWQSRLTRAEKLFIFGPTISLSSAQRHYG